MEKFKKRDYCDPRMSGAGMYNPCALEAAGAQTGLVVMLIILFWLRRRFKWVSGCSVAQCALFTWVGGLAIGYGLYTLMILFVETTLAVLPQDVVRGRGRSSTLNNMVFAEGGATVLLVILMWCLSPKKRECETALLVKDPVGVVFKRGRGEGVTYWLKPCEETFAYRVVVAEVKTFADGTVKGMVYTKFINQVGRGLECAMPGSFAVPTTQRYHGLFILGFVKDGEAGVISRLAHGFRTNNHMCLNAHALKLMLETLNSDGEVDLTRFYCKPLGSVEWTRFTNLFKNHKLEDCVKLGDTTLKPWSEDLAAILVPNWAQSGVKELAIDWDAKVLAPGTLAMYSEKDGDVCETNGQAKFKPIFHQKTGCVLHTATTTFGDSGALLFSRGKPVLFQVGFAAENNIALSMVAVRRRLRAIGAIPVAPRVDLKARYLACGNESWTPSEDWEGMAEEHADDSWNNELDNAEEDEWHAMMHTLEVAFDVHGVPVQLDNDEGAYDGTARRDLGKQLSRIERGGVTRNMPRESKASKGLAKKYGKHGVESAVDTALPVLPVVVETIEPPALPVIGSSARSLNVRHRPGRNLYGLTTGDEEPIVDPPHHDLPRTIRLLARYLPDRQVSPGEGMSGTARRRRNARLRAAEEAELALRQSFNESFPRFKPMPEAEEADCPLCLDTSKAWVQLSCKHVVCQDCLPNLYDRSGDQVMFPCPLCRAITEVVVSSACIASPFPFEHEFTYGLQGAEEAAAPRRRTRGRKPSVASPRAAGSSTDPSSANVVGPVVPAASASSSLPKVEKVAPPVPVVPRIEKAKTVLKRELPEPTKPALVLGPAAPRVKVCIQEETKVSVGLESAVPEDEDECPALIEEEDDESPFRPRPSPPTPNKGWGIVLGEDRKAKETRKPKEILNLWEFNCKVNKVSDLDLYQCDTDDPIHPISESLRGKPRSEILIAGLEDERMLDAMRTLSDRKEFYRTSVECAPLRAVLEGAHVTLERSEELEGSLRKIGMCRNKSFGKKKEKDMTELLAIANKHAVALAAWGMPPNANNPGAIRHSFDVQLRKRSPKAETCLEQDKLLDVYDSYPTVRSKDRNLQESLHKLVELLDGSKSSGFNGLTAGRSADKKWFKQNATETVNLVFLAIAVMHCYTAAEIASMTPQQLLEAGLILPLMPFIKQEPHTVAKLKEGRYRLIFRLAVVAEVLFGHYHRAQNKADIAAYQAETLPGPFYPAIGVGHDDVGLQRLGRYIEKLGETGEGVGSSDASGWDMSFRRAMWMADAARRADRIDSTSTEDNQYDYRCLLKVAFMSSAHVVLIGDELFELDDFGPMPSGHPSTGDTNTFGRGATMYCVHSKPALAVGDDLLKRARLALEAMQRLIRSGINERDAVHEFDVGAVKGQHNFNSHDLTKVDGKWQAKYLNFDKLVVRLLFLHGAANVGGQAGCDAVAGGLHVLRYNSVDLARYTALVTELGYGSVQPRYDPLCDF